MEGYGDGQLTESQSCSFHWINLLFLKNPQRMKMTVNMSQCGCACVCILQSGPWPTLKSSHHSDPRGLQIPSLCICAHIKEFALQEEPFHKSLPARSRFIESQTKAVPQWTYAYM